MITIKAEHIKHPRPLLLIVVVATVMAALLLVTQYSPAADVISRPYTLESSYESFQTIEPIGIGSLTNPPAFLPAAEYQELAKTAYYYASCSIDTCRDVHFFPLHIRAPPQT